MLVFCLLGHRRIICDLFADVVKGQRKRVSGFLSCLCWTVMPSNCSDADVALCQYWWWESDGFPPPLSFPRDVCRSDVTHPTDYQKDRPSFLFIYFFYWVYTFIFSCLGSHLTFGWSSSRLSNSPDSLLSRWWDSSLPGIHLNVWRLVIDETGEQ